MDSPRDEPPRGVFSFDQSRCAWNMRESTSAVPETDNLNPFVVTFQPVDDSIRAANDFPQVVLAEFRHHAAEFMELRQTFGAGDQFITAPGGGVRIVLGNVADNVRQIDRKRTRLNSSHLV